MIVRMLTQGLESLKEEGLKSTVGKVFYWRKEAILVSKNLALLEPRSDAGLRGDLQFFDIASQSFVDLDPQFPVKSRQFKTTEYLNRDYGGFALMRGRTVEGDMWYVTSSNSTHRDLRLLGLDNTFGLKEAYIFDVYVTPEKRKDLTVVTLFREALYALKDKGITKVYAYFLPDNVGASSLVGLFKLDIEKRLEFRRLLLHIAVLK